MVILELSVTALTACLFMVRAQPPNLCNLDRLRDFSLAARLLQNALVADGQGDEEPTVVIQEINVVCLASAPVVGLYRSASLVVEYTCSGVNCPSGE